MRKAKVGQRVGNRFGEEGTIIGLRRGEALVEWDDGWKGYTLTDNLHPLPTRVARFSWVGWFAVGMLGVMALSVLIFGR